MEKLNLFKYRITCLIVLFSVLFFTQTLKASTLKAEQVNLFSNYTMIDGKQPMWLLFEIKLLPHWHAYWRNPGESGLAPKLEFSLPKGFSASSIIWQPPERLFFDTLVNYGYSGIVSLLVKITPNAQVTTKNLGESLPIRLKANWLVCKEVCLPQSKELEYQVRIGQINKKSIQAEHIQQLLESSQLPLLQGKVAQQENNKLKLVINKTAVLPDKNQIKELYFFPDSRVFNAEPHQAWKEDKQQFKINLSYLGQLPTEIMGDLLIVDKQQIKHYWRVNVGKIQANSIQSITGEFKQLKKRGVSPTDSKQKKLGIDKVHENSWLMLWFAFVGGIILNIMPCVFPILSLKVIGLTKHTDEPAMKIKLQGIMYTLGVVLSLLVLGVFLVVLKSLGHAIGWGYQLQSPFIISFLIYLFFLIGLNLSGLYEITIPGLNYQSQKTSLSSHFFTGVLATIVATPCSAPFMATALGFALVTPSLMSLGIFIALGLGLAFPYLLLCFVPALANKLPKPGQWMVNLKEFLAFPMYLTVVWLLFVFFNQVGMSGLFLLIIGLVAIVFAIWLYQKFNVQHRLSKILMWLISAVLVVVPWFYAVTENEETTSDKTAQLQYQDKPYNKKTLDQLLEQGKPVFVYVTADWCITCKMNERTTLNTKEIRNYFKEEKITVLKADWTKRDAQITQFLGQFERSTVPLYVFFPADQGKFKILPQILTPSIMKEYLS